MVLFPTVICTHIILWFCVLTTADPYIGTQCPGVFDNITVDLDNNTTRYSSGFIDISVSTTISYFYQLTVWNTQECVSRLREHYCMIYLSQASNKTVYCKDACLDLGPECQYYSELAVEYYPQQAEQIYTPCEQFPDADCFPGSPSNYTENEPVCPLPFVIPDADSYARDGLYIYWIWGTACAFPCLPVIYSNNQFEAQRRMFQATFVIAFVFSFLLLVNSIMSRQHNLTMFALGTFNGAFWMTIFMSLNENNELICSGNAGVDQYNPFCVFSGFMLLASLNWFSAWSFNISFRVWSGVSKRISSLTMKKIDKYFWVLVFFLPSLLFINLGVGNIGYEYMGGTSCICYNLYDIQPKYWHYITTFSPVIIFAVILPGIFLIDTLRIVTKGISGEYMVSDASMTSISERSQVSGTNSVDGTFSPLLAKIWKFKLNAFFRVPIEQWKLLKFVIFGVVLTMFFCFSDLYATYYLDPKNIVKNGVECVLLNATPDPNEALNVCGSDIFAINGVWTVYSLVLYGGIFGTIPLLIFGFKFARLRTINFFKQVFQRNENRSNVSDMNDRESTEAKKSNEMSDLGNDDEGTHNPMNND